MADGDGIILIAERVMGLDIAPHSYERVGKIYPRVDIYHDGMFRLHTSREDVREWNPFESHADAYEVEERLPEELRHKYARTLHFHVVRRGAGSVEQDIWLVAHASPRQRMEAVCAVLKEEQK